MASEFILFFIFLIVRMFLMALISRCSILFKPSLFLLYMFITGIYTILILIYYLDELDDVQVHIDHIRVI